MYCIYYLPNAIPGVTSKIGRTRMDRQKQRYTENKFLGYDMTGYTILIDNIPDLQLTKDIEHLLQRIYDCVDGTRAKEVRERISKNSKNKIMSAESKQKNRKAHIGTMWITNDVISKMIHKSDPIPYGFRPGRLYSRK